MVRSKSSWIYWRKMAGIFHVYRITFLFIYIEHKIVFIIFIIKILDIKNTNIHLFFDIFTVNSSTKWLFCLGIKITSVWAC